MKLINQAEKLYLKAAESAGNAYVKKMILAHRPELEEEKKADIKLRETNYKNAQANHKIIDHISKVKSGLYKDNDNIELTSPPPDVLNRLSEIMGFDFSGYEVVIEARQINHILNDHGEEGSTDHSMSDDIDIAKLEYVLASPDSIEKAGKTQAYSYMRNGYNRTADTVRYEKIIGENSYYVIQALPIAKKNEPHSSLMLKTSMQRPNTVLWWFLITVYHIPPKSQPKMRKKFPGARKMKRNKKLIKKCKKGIAKRK